MKDKIFVCQKCEKRLLKKSPPCELSFKWTDENFISLKKEHIQETGQKTIKKVVLTSCLGLCPEKAVAYQETFNGVLGEELSYPSTDGRAKIKKRFFK